MALLGSLLWDSIAALMVLVIIAYHYGTSTHDFFKKRGIPYVKPLPFVGNFGGVISGRSTMSGAIKSLYVELKKHRLGGVFQARAPAVMVCDIELVKLVLTKDFSSLHDHGSNFNQEADPLSANLFDTPGSRWKNLRTKLSPVFTSGKLKQMFPLIKDVADQLNIFLRDKAETGEIVEFKDVLLRFSTDVVGTTTFGVECNSLKNRESQFYKTSQCFFRKSVFNALRFSVLRSNKLYAKLVPLKKLFPNLQEFFFHLMEETIKYRTTNNVERNDFVQMLMQLQKNDEGKTKETHPDEIIFNETIIASQAFFFFLAGLDAIASTIGFALHHLSIDTRLQEDLADEVHSVISHHNGELTYEGLREMKLLDMVISECMRMYPPGGLIFRIVTAPTYTFPGTDVTLEKGTRVLIPIYGIHSDPEFYHDPTKFDPYRFTEEECKKRPACAYLPFGEGPRVCIANRFSLLEMHLCLASLIKEYKFSVCSKTEIPLTLETQVPAVTPAHGFNLKIEKRAV